jgi:hypothetical protein
VIPEEDGAKLQAASDRLLHDAEALNCAVAAFGAFPRANACREFPLRAGYGVLQSAEAFAADLI